jgi:hypothetical protein
MRSQPSGVSIGVGPAPIFVDSHVHPMGAMTWRWRPQWTRSGLSEKKMSPNGVCPLSLGRLSMA